MNDERDVHHAEMKAKAVWRVIIAGFVVLALLWYGTHR
jgi:uncharacterized integral membrane protein